jgi:hypothetical protein
VYNHAVSDAKMEIPAENLRPNAVLVAVLSVNDRQQNENSWNIQPQLEKLV